MIEQLTIKRITTNEAEILSEVAIRAYKDHYLHLWNDDGRWYIQKSFSINQLQFEIEDANNGFYFAIIDQNPVGFIKIRPINQLSDHEGDGFEIERIYLTKEATGKKIGNKLMIFAIEIAKNLQKDYVWLKAMDSSHDAIRFYQNLGFVQCGTSRLDFELLKDEIRGMVTMKLDL